MSSLSSLWFVRQIATLSAAVALALGTASAQSPSAVASAQPVASPASGSSSLQFLADNSAASAAILPSAPQPAGGGQMGGYPSQVNPYQSRGNTFYHHLAFEVGGGFNAPSRGSSPYITWGGNFTAGAGYRFNSYLSMMLEYQIIDDKLPGMLAAEAGSNGANAHIWSFTLDPVVDLFPKRANDFYITGGGGFYRKMTNFTDPGLVDWCDYFYCGVGVSNVVVGHFSSNQGGWNIGAGYSHTIASDYDNGRIKLFAEARYLDVETPAVESEPNGLGLTRVAAGTKLVPVTFGVRW
ncbi:MAG: hypothetical protein ACP5FH_09650 [Terracidiphilus sp.]